MGAKPRRRSGGRAGRVCLAILCFGLGACTNTSVSPKPPTTLRVATYAPNSLNYRVVAALVEPLRSRGIQIEIIAGSGRENVDTLERREADIALAATDAGYFRYTGDPDSRGGAFGDIRGIASLRVTAAVLVTGSRSGIHAIPDLSGRSVYLGPAGRSRARMATAVLDAYGVVATAKSLSSEDEVLGDIVNGTLDAAFIPTSLNGADLDKFVTAGARLVPISGPPIERLLLDNPFWRPAVVRPRQPTTPITTIGGVNSFLCLRTLDARLVYVFTTAFFELVPTLSSDLGLQPLDKLSAAATGVPLHEGAVRYYRERTALP